MNKFFTNFSNVIYSFITGFGTCRRVVIVLYEGRVEQHLVFLRILAHYSLKLLIWNFFLSLYWIREIIIEGFREPYDFSNFSLLVSCKVQQSIYFPGKLRNKNNCSQTSKNIKKNICNFYCIGILEYFTSNLFIYYFFFLQNI